MTASATFERSRVLLIDGTGHDERGKRMVALALELLEADGMQADLLDPARHQASDVYEKWLFAHAVLVIAPAGTSAIDARFKAAIERMARAGYPSRLAERAYGVVVHGDETLAGPTRRALCGWFESMGMVDSDSFAALDRYLGYHELPWSRAQPLKGDADYQAEVRNVAHAVANAVTELRAGRLSPPERRGARRLSLT